MSGMPTEWPEVERLVAALMVFGFPAPDVTAEIAEFIGAYGLGGVALFGRNVAGPERLRRMTADLQDLSDGQPLLVAVDQEGGSVTRFWREASVWPSPMAFGATHDPGLTRAAAQAGGSELRALGINLNLAPVADILIDARNPVIGTRAYGDDPEAVAAHVGASVAGHAAAGVATTAKHFPGHGDTPVDSHQDLPEVTRTLDELSEVDLVPFRAAARAGVDCVMTSHVWYRALDAVPTPATLSPAVTRLLRDTVGFEGVIITDCLEMGAIRNRMSTGEAAVRALAAGADLVTVSHLRDRQMDAFNSVLAAVREGVLSHGRLQESFLRVSALKQKLARANEDSSAAEGLPRDVADRSVTLVRDHNRTLPLRAGMLVGVITFEKLGPSSVEEQSGGAPGLVDLVRERGASAVVLALDADPCPLSADQLETLCQADVVLVATSFTLGRTGQSHVVRQILDLSVPTVVVATRDPFDLLAFDQAPCFLATYGGVGVSMEAAAAILFGEAPPRGRLPVAIGDLYPRGSGLSSTCHP